MIKVKNSNATSRSQNQRVKRFLYEDLWSIHGECKEIIKCNWKENKRWSRENPIQQFRRKIEISRMKLKEWSIREFGGRKRKLGKN